MDPDPLVLQQPVALDARVVRRQQLRIGALAQVVEERVALGEVLVRRSSNWSASVNAQHRLVDGLLAGLERLELDVADHEALERVAQLRRALDRGHAADHGLGLDVLEHRLGVGVAQGIGGQADVRLVVGVARPLVAVGPRRVAVGRRPTATGSCRPCGCAGRSARGRRARRCPPRPPCRIRPGGADARGATPWITPLTSMYRAPSSITVPLSNVTRCPRTTSGSGSSGAAGCAMRRS